MALRPLLISATAGAVGGLAASAVAIHHWAPALSDRETAPTVPCAPRCPDDEEVFRPREAPGRAQASVPTSTTAPAAPPHVSVAPRPPPPESTEERELLREEAGEADVRRFEDDVRQLENEPVDRAWAPAAEALLAESVESFTDTHAAHLDGISCRSTGCVVELSWESRGEAENEFSAFGQIPPLLNCAMEVTLAPNDDRAAQQYAKILYDCRDSPPVGYPRTRTA